MSAERKNKQLDTNTSARDAILKCIDEMVALDNLNLVAQLKEDPSSELQFNWKDVKERVNRREYKTFSMIAADIRTIQEHLAQATKKSGKYQRYFSQLQKNVKKQWTSVDLIVRAKLYDWHPQGRDQAAAVRPPAPRSKNTCLVWRYLR
jgi:predicted enzyme involved in methoxymalonyl-ACP biosynthesis